MRNIDRVHSAIALLMAMIFSVVAINFDTDMVAHGEGMPFANCPFGAETPCRTHHGEEDSSAHLACIPSTARTNATAIRTRPGRTSAAQRSSRILNTGNLDGRHGFGVMTRAFAHSELALLNGMVLRI